MWKLCTFWLVLGLFCNTDGFKVLVLYPFPIRSINILGEGVVRILLKAGHEVTYATVYPMKNPPKENFTQVDLSSAQQLFANDVALNTGYVMYNELETDPLYIQETGVNCAKLTIGNQNFLRLLQDSSVTFDVVIADFVETELYAGLAALYQCPMIWVYSMGAHTVALKLVDQPANPAYTMDYLTPNTAPFTYSQRVEQLWSQLKWFYYKQMYTMPEEKAMYNDFFGPYFAQRGLKLPDYQELIYNASLILSNEHHSVGNIPALPQNFKLVGGFHIEVPTKPLPKDLQTLMDNAKNGVIYFSMGSTWQSKDIPKSVTEGLLKMFGELKQTVIWKYEEDLPGTPSNVHIIKWAPQQSILAHPNLLFFITHGGHLSSTEAFHFGVPLIGIPVYFDQHVNVKKAVSKGYAIAAKLSADLPKDLKLLIQEMLQNPKYRRTARALSQVYHDRPVAPGAELAHWVRHVVATGGAPHLRSPALLVPFYQKLFLDVLAAVILTLVILAFCIKLAVRQFVGHKSKPIQNKKKYN